MADVLADLVSVLIPAYRHADHIDAAIRSVLKQTHQNLEILIQDDCSDDGTWHTIQKFSHWDKRVIATRTEQTIGGAANHLDLLNRARGQFVAMLSSDDLWHPHKTALQIALLQESPEAVAVFGQAEFIDSVGGRRDDRAATSPFLPPLFPSHKLLRHMFDHGNILCHPASMVRREAMLAVPRLDTARIYASLPDLFFWIGLGGRGNLLMHEDVVTQFRLHDDGSNASTATLPNKIRDQNEFQYVLQAFLDYPPDRLQAVFADRMEAGLSRPSAAIRLAQYAARLRSPPHAAFALAVAFEVMKDPANVSVTTAEIGFGLQELHRFSRWCDGLGTGRDYLRGVAAQQWQGRVNW